MRTQRNGVVEAAEEAQGTIAETAQTVIDAATAVGGKAQEYATTVGGKAQEYATEAGRQATAAAQTAYSTGNDALAVVEDLARENIWPALLIAGAVGYGLACLFKSTR